MENVVSGLNQNDLDWQPREDCNSIGWLCWHLTRQQDVQVAAMAQDKAMKERQENSHPIGFIGKPIDVAYAVLSLVSDESRLVTGAEMVIDGGWTARWS
jgi:NAD(P)-dependent dehydrogenase (short-subunit alcohol dehydrogenase family)